jgi:hypothetical protein
VLSDFELLPHKQWPFAKGSTDIVDLYSHDLCSILLHLADPIHPLTAQGQCGAIGSRCLYGSQLWVASGENGTLGRARIGSGHTSSRSSLNPKFSRHRIPRLRGNDQRKCHAERLYVSRD